MRGLSRNYEAPLNPFLKPRPDEAVPYWLRPSDPKLIRQHLRMLKKLENLVRHP